MPGFGWSAATAAPLAHPSPSPVAIGRRSDAPVAVVLGNGLVSWPWTRPTGTFAVDGVGGFGRLVDGGDLGDSYNYSPPAA